MPRAYEAMRDKFISEGMNEKAAKGKAARIYNSTHHNNPVTRSSDERKQDLYMMRRRRRKRNG